MITTAVACLSRTPHMHIDSYEWLLLQAKAGALDDGVERHAATVSGIMSNTEFASLELTPQTQEAIQEMGFVHMTEVQARTIPPSPHRPGRPRRCQDRRARLPAALALPEAVEGTFFAPFCLRCAEACWHVCWILLGQLEA